MSPASAGREWSGTVEAPATIGNATVQQTRRRTVTAALDTRLMLRY